MNSEKLREELAYYKREYEERLRVNVGLIEENKQLKRKADSAYAEGFAKGQRREQVTERVRKARADHPPRGTDD